MYTFNFSTKGLKNATPLSTIEEEKSVKAAHFFTKAISIPKYIKFCYQHVEKFVNYPFLKQDSNKCYNLHVWGI